MGDQFVQSPAYILFDKFLAIRFATRKPEKIASPIVVPVARAAVRFEHEISRFPVWDQLEIVASSEAVRYRATTDSRSDRVSKNDFRVTLFTVPNMNLYTRSGT